MGKERSSVLLQYQCFDVNIFVLFGWDLYFLHQGVESNISDTLKVWITSISSARWFKAQVLESDACIQVPALPPPSCVTAFTWTSIMLTSANLSLELIYAQHTLIALIAMPRTVGRSYYCWHVSCTPLFILRSYPHLMLTTNLLRLIELKSSPFYR